LLAPRPKLKLDYLPLSAVRDYLFSTFAATLHIGRRNLRTRHDVVTGTRLSRSVNPLVHKFWRKPNVKPFIQIKCYGGY